MRGVSHVAVGVRDMDKLLDFYRDLLGLRVVMDEVQDIGDIPAMREGSTQRPTRRVVHLIWKDEPAAPFIVLSEFRDSSRVRRPGSITSGSIILRCEWTTSGNAPKHWSAPE